MALILDHTWGRSGRITIAMMTMLAASALSTNLIIAEDANRSSPQGRLDLELPDGWRRVSHVRIDDASVAKITKRSGLSIATLFNSRVEHDGVTLQINTMFCDDFDGAVRTAAMLKSQKPSSLYVARTGTTIYEMVVRSPDDARAAVAARDALELVPAIARYEVAFDVIPVRSFKNRVAVNASNLLFNRIVATRRGDNLGDNRGGGSNDGNASDSLAAAMRTVSMGDAVRLIGSSDAMQVRWRCEGDVQTADKDGEFVISQLPAKTIGDATVPMAMISGTIRRNCDAVRSADGQSILDASGATTRFPVDDPAVTAAIRDIVGENWRDIAPEVRLRRILRWTSDSKQLRHGGPVGGRSGVPEYLRTRVGRCWDASDLLITLCRAVDLPSRQVFGWLSGGEGHVWTDVAVDGRWRMVDPATGMDCDSDYVPFAIRNDGELGWVYASMPKIDPQPQ